jgi:polysaccharide biosynthesis protein PslH
MIRLPPTMEVPRAEVSLSIAFVYSRSPLPMKRADQMTVAHLLEFLHARGHKVDLFTLDDGEPVLSDADDWLAHRCRSVHVLSHGIRKKAMGLVRGFLRRWPLQVALYHSKEQTRCLAMAMSEKTYDFAYCYYLRTAEALLSALHQATSAPTSVLALQLSQSLNTRRIRENHHTWYDRVVYGLESRLIRKYEARIWSRFAATVLIGPQDVEEIRSVCREEGVAEIDNWVYGPHGVDTNHFSPRPNVQSEPFSLVFCGAMMTNTNVDAITWFCDNVWPLVLSNEPRALLRIVGREPSRAVRRLSRRARVEVLGEVADVADHLCRAAVFVNPIRSAAGQQNKLLEALSMARPVVATPMANEGIGAVDGRDILIASQPAEFCRQIMTLFNDSVLCEKLGHSARRFVEAEWTWEHHFLRLEEDLYRVGANGR